MGMISAYVEKWDFEYGNNRWQMWIARDGTGACVAAGDTLEICCGNCRLKGYMPIIKGGKA